MNKLLSDPVKIGNITLKNRMYAAPMVSLYADEDGNVTRRLVDIYRKKARGGWGLVCVEAASIRYDGRLFSRMLGIYRDQQIAGLNELAEAINEEGALSCIQIMHGGRQANSRFNGNKKPSAPSPVAPWPPDQSPPDELTPDECSKMADDFAAAAGRAKEAGFDCVQLHAAHGFLMQQFISPYTNIRSDHYGDKLAFVKEVIIKVRNVVGHDYPIGIRMSADEFLGEKGILIDSFVKEVAPEIEKAGVDWIDISAGTFETLVHWIPPLYFKNAYLADLAAKVKDVVSIPVSGIGKINDPHIAERIVREEKVDIAAFGRQVLADTEFANKTLAGKKDSIRKCIVCDMGCTDRLLKSFGIKCAVNYEMHHTSPVIKSYDKHSVKRVLVTGGGVAGMEAARVLAMKGHRVILCEKKAGLGGLVKLVSAVPEIFTHELMNIVTFLKKQIENLGVEIHLNKEVNIDYLNSIKPDEVVIASGSLPVVPDIPGIDNKKVITLDEYLMNTSPEGEKIIVLGGNYGAEAALSLARKGRQVTVIEESNQFAAPPYIHYGRMLVLQEYLKEAKVNILTESSINNISDDKVSVTDSEGNRKDIKCDTVISATGRVSDFSLAGPVKEAGYRVHLVGDCVAPLNILNAVHSSARIARGI